MPDPIYSWSFTSPAVMAAKMRNPSASIMSESFALSIGKILMHWSTYEQQFNQLFFTIIKYRNDPVNKPDRKDYKAKDSEFRRMISSYEQSHTDLHKMLTKLLDEATDLQLRRNVIAHGSLSWTGKFLDGEMLPTMRADGDRTPVQHEYTEDELDTFTYAYAYIAGLTMSLNRAEHDAWLVSQLPAEDIRLLKAINNVGS